MKKRLLSCLPLLLCLALVLTGCQGEDMINLILLVKIH